MLTDGRSRGELKRLGQRLDALGPAAKRALVALAATRGVELPEDAASWPGKRLIRRARGLDREAQRLGNPIHRDEAFVCVACGASVPPHGRSARDHCPHCLVGLHVDGDVPGDRASDCGGRLEPYALDRDRGRWMLRYRCARCGAERRNQVLEDGDPPDDWAVVVRVRGG